MWACFLAGPRWWDGVFGLDSRFRWPRHGGFPGLLGLGRAGL